MWTYIQKLFGWNKETSTKQGKSKKYETSEEVKQFESLKLTLPVLTHTLEVMPVKRLNTSIVVPTENKSENKYEKPMMQSLLADDTMQFESALIGEDVSTLDEETNEKTPSSDLIEEPDAVLPVEEEDVQMSELKEETDAPSPVEEEDVQMSELKEETDAVLPVEEEDLQMPELIEEPDAVLPVEEEDLQMPDLIDVPDTPSPVEEDVQMPELIEEKFME